MCIEQVMDHVNSVVNFVSVLCKNDQLTVHEIN